MSPPCACTSLILVYLTSRFSSAHSIRNYISGVRTLHKEIGVTPVTMETFQVSCLLWAADIFMRMPPLQGLPILPPLFHHLCIITPSLGALGPALQVCLTFGFFTMVRKSNLVPLSAAQFGPSLHTCRGDILMAPLGLQILVWWTKTHQSVGRAPVLPIPELPEHPTDPVAAYLLLLAASPTTSADQPLLTYLHWGCCTMVTIPILSQALATLPQGLLYDTSLFSLHSLCRGGATSV